MSYTEFELTTDLHRKWAAISAVAGALERRVWVPAGDRIAFPNLYTLLVAPPGVGKQIIETTKDLWSETIEVGTSDKPVYHVAADSVSHASLIDDLAKAKCSRLNGGGPPITYHSLLIPAEEFEVLLPSYDPLMIGRLNKIFNNPSSHKETRRHGPAKEVMIERPQLNILAGATPAYFTAHFPEEAWSTGLIRRTIMVFQSESSIKDIFAKLPDQSSAYQRLLEKTAHFSELYGAASWSEEAFTKIRDWHLAGGPPIPRHSKLTHYIRTRTLFVLKLSLISAVSRLGRPAIEKIDVQRAMEWLFEAEGFMPDIFREMVGKSDNAIIEELHYFVQAAWVRRKQRPVKTTEILDFLSHRLPSDKIPRVFELAEALDVIARVAGTDDCWIPRPKHLHGVE